MRYEIHPSIGIARVGNSVDQFYLAPDEIGGLPIECEADGTPLTKDGHLVRTSKFKDSHGRVRRQAARFRIFVFDEKKPDDPGREVVLGKDVTKMEWTAHPANKKAAWYNFSELEGDLMLGADNSYEKKDVPLRNASVTDKRVDLIIDPGPRTISGPGQHAEFSRQTIPHDYPFGHFPGPVKQGFPIDTLGEIRTDKHGFLIALGAFGRAGGNTSITSFAGADTWHDDISDGPVTCRVTLADQTTLELTAWLIVGSPKFAPELVNIVTLDDIAFDVAVRYHTLCPEMFDEKRWKETHGWNPEYKADFNRDIGPLMARFADYQWVANVQSMTAFASPRFDVRDASPALLAERKEYFSYFRVPAANGAGGTDNQLFDKSANVPSMPLNSGSNSVSNEIIDKFLTLTLTQYFLMGQWAAGKFEANAQTPPLVHPLDRGSIGNCVGSPMCPGIEVTWSTRNPKIYGRPFQIRHQVADYRKTGLNPGRDECEGGGCEPGDLTKRMAIPWQADFFQCTVQFVNFTNDAVNKGDGIPTPPTYYAYWWPPQSPMFVLSGITDQALQAQAGVPSGFQVSYPRGINSFSEMILAWSYLGFVHNRNVAQSRTKYPYFEEVERNHGAFVASSVAVGSVGNFVNNTDSTFIPMWFLKSDALPAPTPAAAVGAQAMTPASPTQAPKRVRVPNLSRMRSSRE